MGAFTQLNSCMVCSSRSLSTAVDLGHHALASRFPAPGEPDPPSGPLILKECLTCGHLQLSHQVAPGEVWRPGYGYRSSVNETMRDHLQDIAHSFIGLLRPGDAVLDIGSNDGELLRHIGGYFPGVHRFGVDPLGDDVPGAQIIKEYFGSQILPKCKVITSVAMFYDVPDPIGFANAVARTLADDGVWCLEVADAAAMWDGAWDGICHEHLGYYTPTAIRRVARQAGLKVVALTANTTNGGSLRFWLVKGDSGPPNPEPRLDLRELSAEIGIAGKALRRCLIDLRAGGHRVMVLGASTKGNTLLQSCLSHEAAREMILAAVDRFPEKAGRQLPGSRIPIVEEDLIPPSGVPMASPDYFLVLPWHFRENILSRGKALWPEAKFIFPLPKLEII